MKQKAINFKAWDKKKKKMVFVLSISLESETIVVAENYGKTKYYELSYPKQAILIQIENNDKEDCKLNPNCSCKDCQKENENFNPKI